MPAISLRLSRMPSRRLTASGRRGMRRFSRGEGYTSTMPFTTSPASSSCTSSSARARALLQVLGSRPFS